MTAATTNKRGRLEQLLPTLIFLAVALSPPLSHLPTCLRIIIRKAKEEGRGFKGEKKKKESSCRVELHRRHHCHHHHIVVVIVINLLVSGVTTIMDRHHRDDLSLFPLFFSPFPFKSRARLHWIPLSFPFTELGFRLSTHLKCGPKRPFFVSEFSFLSYSFLTSISFHFVLFLKDFAIFAIFPYFFIQYTIIIKSYHYLYFLGFY